MLANRYKETRVVKLRLDRDTRSNCAYGRNFTVERVFGKRGEAFPLVRDREAILICADAAVSLHRQSEAEHVTGRETIFIAPPGEYEIRFEEAGECFILSPRGDDDQDSGSAGEAFDSTVAPIGQPYVRMKGVGQVQAYPFSSIETPPGNPRLKFIQGSWMSINLVDYEGVRDRSKLSPHSHPDFEQASLAIHGTFVHHLRMPWGPDASQWQDDKHLEADDGTIIVIPPGVIHTTEGVGSGRHLLIDIFAPVRADFRAKGWFFNGGDYAEPNGAVNG